MWFEFVAPTKASYKCTSPLFSSSSKMPSGVMGNFRLKWADCWKRKREMKVSVVAFLFEKKYKKRTKSTLSFFVTFQILLQHSRKRKRAREWEREKQEKTSALSWQSEGVGGVPWHPQRGWGCWSTLLLWFLLHQHVICILLLSKRYMLHMLLFQLHELVFPDKSCRALQVICVSSPLVVGDNWGKI